MFPKAGNSFRATAQRRRTRDVFAQLVAEALHGALDDSHRAVKTVMLWTGANERTVKNWLAGTHGPHGDYLLLLLGKSDAVLDAIINTLPVERQMELTVRLARRTSSVADAAPPILRPHSNCHELRRRAFAAAGAIKGTNHADDDPSTDPDAVPMVRGIAPRLNWRQVWFLSELLAGARPRACDLSNAHSVSEKTAKRDIAGLRQKHLVRYVGSKRGGHYTALRGCGSAFGGRAISALGS